MINPSYLSYDPGRTPELSQGRKGRFINVLVDVSNSQVGQKKHEIGQKSPFMYDNVQTSQFDQS